MMQYFTLTNVFSSLYHAWATSVFFMIYAVFVFLALYNKKTEKHTRNTAISMFLILIIMYFPPLVNFFAIHYFSSQKYSRIGWGLLVAPVIAYGTVMLIYTLAYNRKQRIWITILSIAFFIVVGINSTSYFLKPSNIYKLPQEAIEVANIINSTEDFNGNIGITFTLSTMQSFTKIEEVYYGLLAYSGIYNIYPINSEGLTNKKYDVLLTETYYPADEIINSGYHLLAETANSKIYEK